MKNYLEARREELRKRGDKGFTLMEMLIVVAIIAVLIAIAIPVFTDQLERSREATDAANIRSAYASLMADYLTTPPSGTDTIEAEVTATQQVDGWQTEPAPTLRTMVNGEEAEIDIPANLDQYTITVDADGTVVVS